MAIALDTSTGNNGTGSPNTYAHTCTGTNLILFVGIRADATTDSVTYNGVGLTKINEVNFSGGFNSLWYLLNPATGSNNVVATSTGSTFIQCVSASYTGVRQSGVPDASNTGTALSTNTISVAVTTVADNSWVIGVGLDNNGAGVQSAGTNTTLVRLQNNSLIMVDSGGPVTPAGNRTLAVNDTAGNADLSLNIASFAPAAAVAATTINRGFALLGVGQ